MYIYIYGVLYIFVALREVESGTVVENVENKFTNALMYYHNSISNAFLISR